MSTKGPNQPVKLTKSLVDQATPPASGQAFLRDSVIKGFGLRLTANGTKSFIVEKRIHGRVRRQTLGRFGELTVEQARKRAQHMLGQIAMGRDPVAEQKQARVKATTLEQTFQDFLKARKNLKPKTRNDYQRAIHVYLKDWRRKPITAITKQMVTQRHRLIGETRGEAQANYALRALRAVLNFAKHSYDDGHGHSILPYNPVEILNHTRAWYRIERRRTVIKAYDLPAWYRAVQSLKQDYQPLTAAVVADFLVLVLFTGLRFNEAATLKWANVDLRDRTLFIPDPKNREPFTLPLSAFVTHLLAERRTLALNDYVFPGRDGIGHLVEPKRQMAHVRDLCGFYFTVNDLRRTFITIAESLDLSTYTLKRLLNHKVNNDVTAGYIISDVERLRTPIEKIIHVMLEACHIADDRKVIALRPALVGNGGDKSE